MLPLSRTGLTPGMYFVQVVNNVSFLSVWFATVLLIKEIEYRILGS
jgi:hypothetical protein